MSAITHFIKKGVRQSQIDEYLGSELGRAGYGGVEIAKTPLGERITIHAARPGIVIGRRGKNIRMITDELVARFGLENPQIEVKEVTNPELNSKVMAYSLVSAIERGVHRRRAAYSVLRRVVNAGAKGCEILISGKLTSKRSRHEAYRMGLVAKSGELGSTFVMRANATAVMKLGTIGVTVNIMRGDVQLPDEISILAVQFEDGKIVEEISPEAVEAIPKEAPKKQDAKEAVTPKKKEAPVKKEEAPKKTEAKVAAKKKTDLDREVEELSDLIEKSPGEEAKPKKTEKKKTPAKTTKKDAVKPKAKTTKKDAVKPKAKTTKKDDAKPKAKTTKKDAVKPKAKTTKKKTTKKDAVKPKAKTTKKDDAKPKAKSSKKDEAKSKDTKAKDSKKDDKDKKSKSKKDAKKK
ncbi:MAG: 30S ribosomal protein S3 [Candidatus Heimdallarchaeota archaeon]